MQHIMKTTKISTLTLGLLASTMVSHAQENITPMMRTLPQRIELNAAMSPTYADKFLQLPIIAGQSVSAENTGFAWGDLYTWGADDSMHLDLGNLHDNMRRINLTSVGVDIPFFGFGTKIRDNHFISVVISNKTRGDVIFHRSLTNLRYGNWDYDNDKPVDQDISNIFIRVMNYMEMALGYSNDKLVDGRLKLGGRIKLLAGVAAVQSDDLKVNFKTEREDDRYRVEMHSSGSIKTSIPFTVKLDSAGYVDNLDFSDADLGDFSPFRNKGLAFDAGATFKLNDMWNFGLSFVDLGFIKWHNECHQFSTASGTVMRGVDSNDNIKDGITGSHEAQENYWDALKDSLLRFTDVTYKKINYRTRMTPRMIAMAEYNLPHLDWLSFGSVVSTKFVNGRAYSRGSVSAHLHKKWFSLIGSLAINPGAHISPGIGLTLQSKVFQFFIMADRFPHNLESSSGAAVSWGINFFPGNRKKRQVEPTAVEPTAE